MFDDFIERRPGAARDLEQSLNRSAVVGSVSSEGQISASTATANDSRANINALGPQSWNVNESLESPSHIYEPCLWRRTQDSTSISCDPERHWLLVCARPKERPTSLTQLELCRTSSDKDLFQELRKTYFSLKSKWSQLLSFKRVQSIRFVQVSRNTSL